MAKTYWVSNESDILNPGERPFRKLERALALAAKAAEECSWKCQTPPAPDNEINPGRGNFRCGVLSAHGIHVQASEDGYWTEEFDVPEEDFRKARSTQRADWILSYVIDRGTGYLADGEDHQFYAGPEQTEGRWDHLLEDIAGSDEIVEATVTPLQHGRYWHLMDEDGDYPLVWRQGHGF